MDSLVQLANLRKVHPAPPLMLCHGEFFGDIRRARRTSSFVFSRMFATWPDGELPRHTHANAYFMFVLRGVYISAASREFCGPSTLIYNPSGTTHRDRFRTVHGSFFAISVCPEIARKIDRALPKPTILMDPEIVATVENADSELRNGDSISELVLEGLGLELAGRACRQLDSVTARIPRWLSLARERTRDGCTSSPAISEIAAVAGVHPVHLARAFRQYYHCSPGEYLRSCRIHKAGELLLGSDLPLADISQQLGFSDQSQFTHAFRRASGHTPSEFRRKHRQ